MNSNTTFEVRVEFDSNKFSPTYQRIGKAECTIAALQSALNVAYAELRAAKKELKDIARNESVTR